MPSAPDATAPDPHPLRVREMATSEAPRVGELTLAAYDAYGRITGGYRDHLADPLDRRRGCSAVLVAVSGDALLGTVTYVRPHDPQWEPRPTPAGDAGFRVLAVDPSQEGRGAGRALVSACLARARAEGRHRLVVTTMAWMTRARRLYDRLGFVHHPDLDLRFPSGIGHTLTRDLTDEAPQRFPPPGPAPAHIPWFEDVWRGRPSDG